MTGETRNFEVLGSAAAYSADTFYMVLTPEKLAYVPGNVLVQIGGGNTVIRATWAARQPGTTGQQMIVLDSDTDTHVDPVAGGDPVPNRGVFDWVDAPTSEWTRVGDNPGAGAADAQALARAYAISDTDAPIPGAVSSGDRGARYYANVAATAVPAAATATAQAGIATTKAGEASDAADAAGGFATTAGEQAGIATTKAGEASDAADAAGGFATTAGEQAGIATTKAGEASDNAAAVAATAATLIFATGDVSGAVSSLIDADGDFIAGVRSDGLFIGSASTVRPKVFSRKVSGFHHVFVRDGARLLQLTTGKHDNVEPEIIQGGLIRFLSNRGGVWDRWIMGPAGDTPSREDTRPLVSGRLMLGQSLVVGNTGGVVTSPANADTRLLQLDINRASPTGPRAALDGTRAGTNQDDPYIPGEIVGLETLVDVLNPNANQPELAQTMSTGLGQHLLKDHPIATYPDTRIGISVVGRGAQTLAQLGPGTNHYGNLRRVVEEWHKHAEAAGMRYEIGAIHLVHDHAHIADDFTRAQHKAAQLKFVNDLVNELSASSAYGCRLPVITSISGNASYNALGGTPAGNAICREVWKGTIESSDEIPNFHIACPMYMLATVDGVHLTAANEDLLGEYHAKCERIVLSGRDWTPTRFSKTRSYERSGTSLFVPVDSMYPLQRVTTTVVARTNDGFVFTDGGSITLTGAPTIDNTAGGLIFTLSGSSLAGPGTLYCASTATTLVNVGQNPANANSAGCNIADTDPEIGKRTGTRLINRFLPDMLENIA